MNATHTERPGSKLESGTQRQDHHRPLGIASPRLGLFLNTQTYSHDGRELWNRVVSMVREARRAGFVMIMAGQNFFASPYGMFTPLPLLARLAGETGSMRVGTGVLLATHVHPLVVAEEIATLDAITDGRLAVGVGLGYRDIEFRLFGIDRSHAAEVYEANVDRLRRLLEGQMCSVSYLGGTQVDEVCLGLRPLQEPRPPLWMAANSDSGVRRAARLADSWLVNPHSRLSTLVRQVRLLRDSATTLGKQIDELPVIREAIVARSHGRALERAGSALAAKYREYLRWNQQGALPSDERIDDEIEALSRDRFLIGGPELVTDQIRKIARTLETDLIVLRVDWPGADPRHGLETISRIGEEVIPRLVGEG